MNSYDKTRSVTDLNIRLK